jgi:hypothetical protein
MAEVFKCGSATCIVVGVSPEFVNAIPLSEKGLAVISFSKKEFSEWSAVPEYPVKKAAQKYVNFAKLHGASNQALRMLKEIINGEPKKEAEMGKKKSVEVVDPEVKVEEKEAVESGKKSKGKKAEATEPRGRKAEWKEFPHIVVNAEAVRSGFVKEFVDYAAGRKSFKVSDLVKKFANQEETRVIRYFTWCRNKGIFAEK